MQLILVDYNLKNFGSHNGTTATTLMEHSSLSEVWANVLFEHDDPRVRKVFNYSGANRRCALPSHTGNRFVFALKVVYRLLCSNIYYYRALCRACAVPTSAVWLARDGDPKMFYALLVAAIRWRKKISIVAYFHNQPSRFLMMPAARIIQFLRVRNLHLSAEDPSLCRKFESILGLPCHYLFNPIPFKPLCQKEVLGKAVRGVMLGGARAEKGFDVLMDALELLRPDLEAGRLEISLQCPSESESGILLSDYVLPPNVTVWCNIFSPEEYEQVLQEADFSVLPYRRSAYELRNSGIVIESIAAGLPMVVTEGTLFAATAQEHGVAVRFKDGEAEDLSKAILQLVDESAALISSAHDKAKIWQQNHSVDRFVEVVEEICGG